MRENRKTTKTEPQNRDKKRHTDKYTTERSLRIFKLIKKNHTNRRKLNSTKNKQQTGDDDDDKFYVLKQKTNKKHKHERKRILQTGK